MTDWLRLQAFLLGSAIFWGAAIPAIIAAHIEPYPFSMNLGTAIATSWPIPFVISAVIASLVFSLLRRKFTISLALYWLTGFVFSYFILGLVTPAR